MIVVQTIKRHRRPYRAPKPWRRVNGLWHPVYERVGGILVHHGIVERWAMRIPKLVSIAWYIHVYQPPPWPNGPDFGPESRRYEP